MIAKYNNGVNVSKNRAMSDVIFKCQIVLEEVFTGKHLSNCHEFYFERMNKFQNITKVVIAFIRIIVRPILQVPGYIALGSPSSFFCY